MMAAEWSISAARPTETISPSPIPTIRFQTGAHFTTPAYVLPAAMLESYVEKWPTPQIENFLYMLRSGMMGWLTIMTDTTAWSPEQQHKIAQEEIALYKKNSVH